MPPNVSVLSTDDLLLAQAGPTRERAFRRTDLFIFEERERVVLKALTERA